MVHQRIRDDLEKKPFDHKPPVKAKTDKPKDVSRPTRIKDRNYEPEL